MGNDVFDIIIIGSGFGGLGCANILSKNGYNVCVVEQSPLFGGSFQSFRRKSRYIDTGMHYVGSMGDGQIMRQYFKYFGIFDKLDILALDENFDSVCLGDEVFYHYGTYEKFEDYLVEKFPAEKNGIKKYCEVLKYIGKSIDVKTHSTGNFSSGGREFLEVSAFQFINDCVKDPLLKSLLAGTNPLYGGTKSASNFYHHAMINHSNIEGAYRFVGNTQKVVDLMVAQIRTNGGTVLNNSRVTNIKINDSGLAEYIELENSRKLFAKNFISNIHPARTVDMISDTPFVKKAYKSRFNGLKNTYGIHSLYLIMKENSFEYINKNLYFFKDKDVWNNTYSLEDKATRSILLTSQYNSSAYSNVITLMSPVETSLFEKWENDENYSQSNSYLDFKEELKESMLGFISDRVEGILDKIDTVYSASPLTNKRYIGSPSAYGILKDYRTSMLTLLSPKTKIKNLYFTGQNLNVHGAIGVSLSAGITCSEFLGKDYLTKEIARA